MLNENALLGSLIGSIILFFYIGLYIIVVKKILKQNDLTFKDYESKKEGVVASIFNMQGIQKGEGCWIYSILYIILFYWINNFNSIIKYAIISFFLNLAFQSLLSFIKDELCLKTNENIDIILSIFTTIIVIMFFSISSLYFSIFVIILVAIIECAILYHELVGLKYSMPYLRFHIKIFSLEDLVFFYTPPIAVLISLIITII